MKPLVTISQASLTNTVWHKTINIHSIHVWTSLTSALSKHVSFPTFMHGLVVALAILKKHNMAANINYFPIISWSFRDIVWSLKCENIEKMSIEVTEVFKCLVLSVQNPHVSSLMWQQSEKISIFMKLTLQFLSFCYEKILWAILFLSIHFYVCSSNP